jgi:hypothetical protein
MHVGAQGLCDDEHDREKDQNLRNANSSHLSTSKFFRPEQRIHQIDEESCRNHSRNGVLHGILLKPLRCFREAPEQNEKRNHDRDIENVQQHIHLGINARSNSAGALESTHMTQCPLARSPRAIRLSGVGHQRFLAPITTNEFGLRAS